MRDYDDVSEPQPSPARLPSTRYQVIPDRPPGPLLLPSHELQERLDADPALAGLAVLGVDPGGMVSGLTRRGSPWLVLLVQWVFPLLVGLSTWLAPNGTLRSVAKSARDVLRAAFDTATLGTTPKALYLNGSEPGDTSSESKDPRKRRELWQASVRYTALRPEETILGRWE